MISHTEFVIFKKNPVNITDINCINHFPIPLGPGPSCEMFFFLFFAFVFFYLLWEVLSISRKLCYTDIASENAHAPPDINNKKE